MAKNLAKMLILGATIIGRSFIKACREELQMSKEAARRAGGGKEGAKASVENLKTGITLEEAQKILDVEDLNNVEQIKKNYEHLFSVNDKSKGGSFYIQSKIVRAKERLDKELESRAKNSNRKKKA